MSAAAPPAKESPAKPRSPGVLVVEDNDGIRDWLMLALPGHGFVVFAAADGHEALRLHRQHRAEIDVALLDVQLPGIDGPAVLAALRQGRPDLPCCFMTGHAGKHAEEELLRAGTEVLAKPFRAEEATAVLRRLCGLA